MKTFNKAILATAMLTTSAFANNHIAKVDVTGKVLQDFKLTQQAGQVIVSKSNHITAESVSYSGQEAIDFLGNRIHQVAQEHHSDITRFKQILLSDPTLHIDKDDKLFVVDAIAPASTNKAQASTVVYTKDASKLHSKPGAKKVIYLNMNGWDPIGSAWEDYKSGPLTSWSGSQSERYALWAMVAEDFAPFDVDVTTEQPSQEALIKTDATDEEYGTTAIITDSDSTLFCKYGCGGLAYVGAINWGNGSTPCLVFANSAGVYGKPVAEATSHEIGHNLSLLHDGTSIVGYYNGNENWAPIMGGAYGANHTQWSKGEYPDANNQEDDLDIISHNLPYDIDTSTDLNSALGLEIDSTTYNDSIIKSVDAIISNVTDQDFYSFTSVGGKATFTVSPKQVFGAIGLNAYANLKPKVSILAEDGSVIAVGTYPKDPQSNEYRTNVTANLPAGNFFIKIEGVGDTFFTNYASIGQYQLTGTYTSSNAYGAPIAVINASTTDGLGPLMVTLDATNSIFGYGSNLKYRWYFDDNSSSSTSVVDHIFTSTGSHVITLVVTNEANLTSSSSITVNVTAPLTNIMKVKSAAISMKYIKKYDMSSVKVTFKLVNEKGKGVKGARICGTFTGSFNGRTNNNMPMSNCGNGNNSGIVTISYPTDLVFGQHGTLTYTISRIDTPTNMVFDSSSQKMVTITK